MKINPLNFFNRRVYHIPPHFTTTDNVMTDYDETKINRWIYEHCGGRYCIVKNLKWIKDSWRPVTTIGFEEPSDMTIFALSGMYNTKKLSF